MKKNNHIGSSFDSFLEEEGILEEVNAAAVKKVIAHHLKEYRKKALLNLNRFLRTRAKSRCILA